jgi:hypothetical protein
MIYHSVRTPQCNSSLKENNSDSDILGHLCHVYGEYCMGTSSGLCWTMHFEDDSRDTADVPCRNWLKTAAGMQWAESWCTCHRRLKVMFMGIVARLGNGHSGMQEMINCLGYQKVCRHWVLWLLLYEHWRVCMDVSSHLLQQYAAKGNNYLLNTVTSNGC